jgi:beta-lactamase class A
MSVNGIWGDPSLIALKEQLMTLIPPESQGRLGFVVTDLSTNYSIGFNGSEAINPASVIKIPVMVEAYIQASQGKLNLDDRLVLKQHHKVPGAGPLYGQRPGQSFSLHYLIECMIHYSDNTATYMLIDRLGPGRITQSMKRLGLRQTVVGTGQLLKAKGINFSTPQDMNLLLAKLANGQVVSPQASREMIHILSQQKYRWGIPRLVPKSVVVADKTGTLAGIKHDCGVVFLSGSPYVISVFTSGFRSMSSAMQVISKVSDTVFLWADSRAREKGLPDLGLAL